MKSNKEKKLTKNKQKKIEKIKKKNNLKKNTCEYPSTIVFTISRLIFRGQPEGWMLTL